MLFSVLIFVLAASNASAMETCLPATAVEGAVHKAHTDPVLGPRRYVGNQGYRIIPGRYKPAQVVHLEAAPGTAEKLRNKKHSIFFSWNLENLFYHVGKFVPDPETGVRHMVADPKPKAPEDIAEVKDRIQRVDPDFAGVQEVEDHGNSDSLETFVRDYLDPGYRACDVKGNDSRGIRVGQFSRGFDVQYESHRDIEWQDPFHPPLYPNRKKLFSRDAGTAILRIPGFKEPYAIVMIQHGKSQRTEIKIDPKSGIIREEEQKGFAALAKYYETLYPGVPIFIMGDFNAEFNVAAFRPIKEAGFEEVFEYLPTRFVPRQDRLSQSYHPLWRGKEQRAVKGQLDYIVGNSIAMKYVLDSRVVRPLDESGREKPLADSYAERDVRGGSDHDARMLIFDNERRLREMGGLP